MRSWVCKSLLAGRSYLDHDGRARSGLRSDDCLALLHLRLYELLLRLAAQHGLHTGNGNARPRRARAIRRSGPLEVVELHAPLCVETALHEPPRRGSDVAQVGVREKPE